MTDYSKFIKDGVPTTSLIYSGKCKQIHSTDKDDIVIVHYKDDTNAYNGIKRAQIANKGVLNNHISSLIYSYLETKGINTHFIKRLDDRNQLCKRIELIPIEVIVRNAASGSMARRLCLEIGAELKNTVYEYCLKNDQLDDPLINEHHIVALGLSTYEELETIHFITKEINKILIEFFENIGIKLVDFKIEFGHRPDGSIILCDELSPDTCRLWDANTHESLDKDRFRRDLGRVGEAYEEILHRIQNIVCHL